MSKINSIDRWRTEIALSEEYRNREFGEYSKDRITKAGENIEYMDKGFSFGRYDGVEDNYTTLNLFHAITKNIVPSLFFKNPRINVLPLRKEDQTSAPLAREILNYYFREMDAETVNKRVIWDAYVLGFGVYKIGYATEFGTDMVDEKDTQKQRDRSLLEKIGLKKPKDQEVVRPEIDNRIINQSPYIQYISPFDFLIDPRARNINEAMWVAQVVRKTVDEMKKNPKYKNTQKLQGLYSPNKPTDSNVKIPESVIEAFKTVELYEVHYRTKEKNYILVISKDSGDVYREHYHEESPYEIDGFQFGMLHFNKHEHKLYPLSDLSKIKNLQDRFTTTLDNIFNQMDRYQPKIAANNTVLSDDARQVLETGDVGSVVYVEGNPKEAFDEIGLTQVKGELLVIIDKIIDIVTIQTGLTKAKLLGVSSADTATGEQLSHGAETLRISDMSSSVEKFLDDQVSKLWQIIRQFANFTDLQLITGEAGIDPQTGETMYSWLPDINSDMSERLITGDFRFDLVVGSTQRSDINVIRKQFENLINIIANSDAIMVAQQQGKKIDVGEFLKMYLSHFPEVVRDIGRIIQDISPQTQGLLPPEQPGPGGPNDQSGMNALRALQAQGVPTQPSIQNAAQ